jgi:hypothetical protein
MNSSEPFRLPDFGPQYERFRLPDFPRVSDLAVAIIYVRGAVLLLKNRGHRSHFILPGDFFCSAEGVPSPETACIHGAQHTIRAAIEELAAQLGRDDAIGLDVSLSIVRKAGTSNWQQHLSTCHYFVVSAQGESRILDPSWQPYIDPARHKMGIWMPYKWVPLDALSMTDLLPPEAIAVCLETLKQP